MRKELTTIIAALIASSGSFVSATDLKMIAEPPVKDSITEIARRFEAGSGQKLDVRISSGLDLLKITSASPFDIAVVLRPLLREPEAVSLVSADSIVGIGSSALGVSIRSGAIEMSLIPINGIAYAQGIDFVPSLPKPPPSKHHQHGSEECKPQAERLVGARKHDN